MRKENELKPEHKIFAEQYVIDWNGTRSYQVAYPESSYESARSSACDLLTKPNIQVYITEIQKDLAKLSGISALSNLNKLKDILESKYENNNVKIKAIEVINKMLDLNAIEKQEINMNTNVVEPVKITFTKK